MSNRPNIRGNMDQNDDFLHKIIGIIPGYKGYADREQRRDADKMLRMYVARQYRDQHAALLRVQQQLARARQLEAIGELDRLGGILQRFIDKVEVATYGYAGMFDAVKVEAAELDQIYAFDEALLDGVERVAIAVAGVEAAAQQGSGPRPGETAGQLPDINTALTQLSTVLDHLNQAWNHRQDLLISGQPVATDEFDRFRTAGAPTTSLPAGTSGGAAAAGTGYMAGNAAQGGASGGTGSWGAATAGEQTQRFDNPGAGGWDSRTTTPPSSAAQGYQGNVPRMDAGETPEADSLGQAGGEGMSNVGAVGGSTGSESSEGTLGDTTNSGDAEEGEGRR